MNCAECGIEVPPGGYHGSIACIDALKGRVRALSSTLHDLVAWTRRCDCRDLCGGAFDRSKDVFVHAPGCLVGAVFARAEEILRSAQDRNGDTK